MVTVMKNGRLIGNFGDDTNYWSEFKNFICLNCFDLLFSKKEQIFKWQGWDHHTELSKCESCVLDTLDWWTQPSFICCKQFGKLLFGSKLDMFLEHTQKNNKQTPKQAPKQPTAIFRTIDVGWKTISINKFGWLVFYLLSNLRKANQPWMMPAIYFNMPVQ